MSPIGLLTSVLHVPKLFVSLISTKKIAKMNEYQFYLMVLTHSPTIRLTGGRLDLLNSIVASTMSTPHP